MVNSFNHSYKGRRVQGNWFFFFFFTSQLRTDTKILQTGRWPGQTGVHLCFSAVSTVVPAERSFISILWHHTSWLLYISFTWIEQLAIWHIGVNSSKTQRTDLAVWLDWLWLLLKLEMSVNGIDKYFPSSLGVYSSFGQSIILLYFWYFQLSTTQHLNRCKIQV